MLFLYGDGGVGFFVVLCWLFGVCLFFCFGLLFWKRHRAVVRF